MRLVALSLLALLFAAPAVLAHGDDPIFDSGMMDAGATFEWTVEEAYAGQTLGYHCHPHPWMIGEIQVVAGAGGATHAVSIVEGDVSDANTWVFEPATIVVHPGDTIVWTNDGSIQHTTTADDQAMEMEEDNGTPAVGVPLVIAALAAVVLVRRKHA